MRFRFRLFELLLGEDESAVPAPATVRAKVATVQPPVPTVPLQPRPVRLLTLPPTPNLQNAQPDD
jgi:hypothetical protein